MCQHYCSFKTLLQLVFVLCSVLQNSLAYDAIDDISASVRSEILIWWHGRIHPANSESDFFDKMATRNRDWKIDHRDTTLDWHCSVIGSVCALGIAEGSSGCCKVEVELFQACYNLRLLRKHGELDEDTFRYFKLHINIIQLPVIVRTIVKLENIIFFCWHYEHVKRDQL